MQNYFASLTVSRAKRLVLVALAAGSTSGCLAHTLHGLSNQPPIDASSAVARDVAYANKHPGPYPRFSDIPNIPTDVRPASAWRSAVEDLKQRKAAVDAEAAALPPAQSDTEGFASNTRSRAAADPADVPPPDAAAQTESYAKSLRDRATPPPTPK